MPDFVDVDQYIIPWEINENDQQTNGQGWKHNLPAIKIKD